MRDDASLLLVTHVPMREGPNGLQIDDQTLAGLVQWCKYFTRITFLGVLNPAAGGSSTAWKDTNIGIVGERVNLIALPHAYRADKMARHFAAVRARLANAIRDHRHLCFTLGAIIGDWPAVAAFEALRQGRAYAAWIDRVEPYIIENKLAGQRVKRSVAKALMPLPQAMIRYLLRKSRVALLQGGDTYAYYARSAPAPHCTYDTHTSIDEQISPQAIKMKLDHVLSGAPLRIIYIGRAAAMKGPFDWLDTLARLRAMNVAFKARWIGDGPDIDAFRQRAAALGLRDHVHIPGFESRRAVLLDAMRQSDLMLFCHKTPESARCLVEALVCGCPIVGYGTDYPRDLVATRGGGLFAPQDDSNSLALRLKRLDGDRRELAALIEAAACSGSLYNEDAVYAHRANLMRLA